MTGPRATETQSPFSRLHSPLGTTRPKPSGKLHEINSPHGALGGLVSHWARQGGLPKRGDRLTAVYELGVWRGGGAPGEGTAQERASWSGGAGGLASGKQSVLPGEQGPGECDDRQPGEWVP